MEREEGSEGPAEGEERGMGEGEGREECEGGITNRGVVFGEALMEKP